MKELNPHILRNAIGQLPVHKAADYIWEEVRWELDRPLTAELPIHYAPENAWNALISKTQIHQGSSHYMSVLPLLFAILLISMPFAPVVKPVLLPIAETSLKTSGKEVNRLSSSLLITPAKSNMLPSQPGTGNLPVTAAAGNQSGLTEERPVPEVSETDQGDFKPKNIPSLAHPDPLKSTTLSNKNPLAPEFRKSDRKFDECSPFDKPQASPFLLASYEPTVFGSPELRSPAHSYSLSAGYEIRRLRVSLGAGHLLLGANGKVNYEYKTNELIYSYDYVDSVYIDPVTHQTYYFTVKVDVYDSVNHTATEVVHDRYSFLKVPVTISYQVAGFRNFSLMLQLTAAYNMLQKDKRSFKPFNESYSRLVSTSIEAKKIRSDFWSAGGGLTLAYSTGRKFELQLTPGVNYRFISPEGIEPEPEPSFSLVFGLLYKINADR